jgi:glycosyltransferase involved in cell wall biosynthesis
MWVLRNSLEHITGIEMKRNTSNTNAVSHEVKRCSSKSGLLSNIFHFYYVGISRVTAGSLDGGARIFIETAKRWVDEKHLMDLLTTKEHHDVCLRYGLLKVKLNLISSYKNLGSLYLIYLLRTLRAIIWTFSLKLPGKENIVIYSGSDFWPDSLPAWVLKMRFPNAKWVAPFYLFASSPFSKESPYRGSRWLRGLFYYFSQVPVYAIVRRYADMVWVTSDPDRWRFIDNRLSREVVVAVRGGVDVKMSSSVPAPDKKKYDAVFIGRFHPQKGVLELIDIWRYVCESKKDAQLALIGVGELEAAVKSKILRYNLGNNVTLFGFKDGFDKLRIFKESKIVVHPAIYDSGGMAACEAMACGLPGVSFDLPALKSYYPKGMLKTPCYDLKAFAENILKLLNDEELSSKISKEALDWSQEWDWDKKAETLLSAVHGLFTC